MSTTLDEINAVPEAPKEIPPPPVEYVYAMRSDAFPGLLKIGRTRDIDKRLKAAATYSAPSPLYYVAIAPTFDSKRDEAEAHLFFKDKREAGEFFRVTLDEVEEYFFDVIRIRHLNEKEDLKNGKQISFLPTGMCVHGSPRPICKKCMGSQICEHDRIHAQCVDCSGSAICEHNQRRAYCVSCHGSQICIHGSRAYRCVKCIGHAICVHKKLQTRCTLCNGREICEHKIRKSQCKKCKGAEICEHDRFKYQCRDCKGSSFCEHGTRRCRCKLCKGSQICEHSLRKEQCVRCTGKHICFHERIKWNCKICKNPCSHGITYFKCSQCYLPLKRD